MDDKMVTEFPTKKVHQVLQNKEAYNIMHKLWMTKSLIQQNWVKLTRPGGAHSFNKKQRSMVYCKLMELSLYCEADIYALIHQWGEIYTLNTSNDKSFPPPESSLKGGLKKTPKIADFQSRALVYQSQNQPAITQKKDLGTEEHKLSSVKRAVQLPVWIPSLMKGKCARIELESGRSSLLN
ncbi:uncharacterized protein CIMG_13144 [Coccidioides immitis RS]|uniref:Uncharacterized protein n=1 Tax=Coccidioides immitis (strain RS) TaxID=246410 RepID=A0A0D8JTN8_COCIM|nr:uncharacterized protein CIMG_13144 [Coccidioides immitis RS]KJF60700.1 hypothetical protein CIMG_13144 [Coccidioides immitis RS]